jgi:hypothetical protein
MEAVPHLSNVHSSRRRVISALSIAHWVLEHDALASVLWTRDELCQNEP